MRRLLAGLCAASLLVGPGFTQQAPKADPPRAEPQSGDDAPIIRSTTTFVLAPVTVTDRDGRFVSGLTPYDFRLFDNGKPQRITEDVADHPISLVVVIQANAATEHVIKQVQKIGSVIDGTILGETGDA